MNGFIHKLETLQNYEYGFDYIKQIEAWKNKRDKEENPKTEEVKEEDERPDDIIPTFGDTPEDKTDEEKPRVLMEGFKKLNVSIKLLTNPISDLYKLPKYHQMFDHVVISLKSDAVVTPEFNVLLKPQAKIYCETADNLVIFKPEQRELYWEKLKEKAESNNWNTVESSFPTYMHFKFNS